MNLYFRPSNLLCWEKSSHRRCPLSHPQRKRKPLLRFSGFPVEEEGDEGDWAQVRSNPSSGQFDLILKGSVLGLGRVRSRLDSSQVVTQFAFKCLADLRSGELRLGQVGSDLHRKSLIVVTSLMSSPCVTLAAVPPPPPYGSTIRVDQIMTEMIFIVFGVIRTRNCDPFSSMRS